IALLILEAGLRISEATSLRWIDVHLEPSGSARFGYLQIREGKSKNAKRSISLTARASSMLKARLGRAVSPMVFPAARHLDRGCPTSIIQHQHQDVREALNLDPEFVIHSLRHTMLTRLGEAGVDAFTIKRIAGHSSITVSERYVHPSNEAMERAMERLESFNGANLADVPTIVPTSPAARTADSEVIVVN